jgi:hypothetical protein
MAIIADAKSDERILTFPSAEVKKLELAVGKFRWRVDLDEGTVSLLQLPVSMNYDDVRDIRRALTMLQDYTKPAEEKKEETKNE